MIQWLKNVLRGRYRHWNDANNRQFSLMWQKSELLAPQVRVVLQEFLISSLSLVDALLGPDKGKDRLLNRDPLSIDPGQFKQLHCVQLGGMTGFFAAINPSLRESLHAGVQFITNDNPEALALFKEFASSPHDLAEMGSKVWCRIVRATGCEMSEVSILDAYPYTVAFGATASEAFGTVRTKMAHSNSE